MESTRHRARINFFEAIKKHAPNVLATLEKEVLPLYLKYAKDETSIERLYQNPLLTPSAIEAKARLWSEPNLKAELKNLDEHLYPVARLQHAISNWAKQSGMVDEWCIVEVLQTLALWCEQGSTGDWAYGPESLTDEDLKFTFSYPLWNFEADSWSSYERKIIGEFTKELSAYRERVEEAAKVNKVAIIETKRKEKSSPHHFTWLVEYQVNGLEYAEIVDKNPSTMTLTSSTISGAVHNTAALIGLTLRKAKRGPHRKR
jgi:hypothetical protein